MLNIPSIKELLHKLSEIQWNITVTLPGKLKRKCSWALYPAKSQKCEKLLFLGLLCVPRNQCGIQLCFMILWIFESFNLCVLVKNNLNFKLDFSTYFVYISGCIIRRKHFMFILRYGARWYWCKKDQKNLPQTSHKIFCQYLIVNSSLLWAFMAQNFCKNSFSEAKSRKKAYLYLPFLRKKSPRTTGFHELTPKLLSIFAGLILHSCGV